MRLFFCCTFLAIALVMAGCAARGVPAQPPAVPPSIEPSLKYLQKPYLDLFELSPKLDIAPAELAAMRRYLGDARKHCIAMFREDARQHDRELRDALADLRRRSASLDDAERRELHCRIVDLRALKSQAEMLAGHAIPVAYDNRAAKLDLIEQWPAQLGRIQEEIAAGTHHRRRFGDVKDIGFREVGVDQERDVQTGQEAVRRMKETGLMPPELENPEIQRYVTDLTRKIAARSDLRVPANLTLLNSREINAFALPGGFFFVERGLLEAVEDEAQLAGVLAHEIAHSAARHGQQLMRRATIASIFYQAAQVAAMVLTGGISGIGTYYALQYGFYGIGLILSLDLLGVSREFELEADILGVQYAWNAGYDPSGFIRFFDKMATQVGYVNSASWFRTHPPFFERMLQTKREIAFLPPRDELITQTTAFHRMKEELKRVTEGAEKEEKDAKRPSLYGPEESCPPPPTIEFEPGQPIETLCSRPPAHPEVK
mgnify:CR=1 FL=1